MIVREVMTRPVVTVDEDTPLKDVAKPMLAHRISGLPVVNGDRPAITIPGGATVLDAAALMLEHRVNRLPVVDGGRLVGIVTRADLVRTFTRSDDDIERELRDDVLLRTLWRSPDSIGIDVRGGEVQLSGRVENELAAEALVSFARRVPGVVAVESRLTWQPNGRPAKESQ